MFLSYLRWFKRNNNEREKMRVATWPGTKIDLIGQFFATSSSENSDQCPGDPACFFCQVSLWFTVVGKLTWACLFYCRIHKFSFQFVFQLLNCRGETKHQTRFEITSNWSVITKASDIPTWTDGIKTLIPDDSPYNDVVWTCVCAC